MSVAVAVGFIALAGVAAETGVVMLIYLDQAMKPSFTSERSSAKARRSREADLNEAIMLGAVERVRPEDDDRRCHHGRSAFQFYGVPAPALRSCNA